MDRILVKRNATGSPRNGDHSDIGLAMDTRMERPLLHTICFSTHTFIRIPESNFSIFYSITSRYAQTETAVGLVAMELSKGRGNVMEKSRMTGVRPLLDFALSLHSGHIPAERGITESMYAGCSEIIPYMNLI